ncbi:hypothetical protein BH11PLA1_BH11PLA1_09010 [soil metagenome]
MARTAQGIGALAQGVAGGAQQGAAAAGGKSAGEFEALLKSAAQGKVSSELPVQIAQGTAVELSPEQLQRVAKAADTAQAKGLTSALLLVDGHALTLDVQTRTITGTFDAASIGSRVGQFDGVLAVPAEGAAEAAQVLPLPAGTLAANPSLLKLLSGMNGSAPGVAPSAAVPRSAA